MWILQINKTGQQFWDSYLHPECVMLMSQDYSPFKDKEESYVIH
jgi:hypothetical protein